MCDEQAVCFAHSRRSRGKWNTNLVVIIGLHRYENLFNTWWRLADITATYLSEGSRGRWGVILPTPFLTPPRDPPLINHSKSTLNSTPTKQLDFFIFDRFVASVYNVYQVHALIFCLVLCIPCVRSERYEIYLVMYYDVYFSFLLAVLFMPSLRRRRRRPLPYDQRTLCGRRGNKQRTWR